MNTLAIGISHIKDDVLYGLYDNNNLSSVFSLSDLDTVKQIQIQKYKIVDQRVVCKK